LICEVKTINPSQDEIAARTGPPKARSGQICVTGEFLKKLRATIEAAKQQMLPYDPKGAADHLVYLIINFDDFFAERKEAYFQQIDEYLADAQVAGIRLVFCNARTAFYRPLQMRSADVDNVG
jgi:hypothetical protein